MASIAAAGNATGIAGCITFVATDGGALVDVERTEFGSPAPWPSNGEGYTVKTGWSWEHCKVFNTTNSSFVVDRSVAPLGEGAA